ncbi:MAG: hypothetical protein RDV48_29020 [Candidatus Eremiobacteraeota bacterium]|nr:hypothetical protein [Candidatus Eremiobacteraeota bacterium]
MKNFVLIGVIALMVFSAGTVSPAEQRTIPAASLTSCTIIGSLGVPLGKIVLIEGVIVNDEYRREKGDEGKTLLKVEKLEGKKPAGELIIPLDAQALVVLKKAGPGDRFRYRGYETGAFTGIPEEAFRYIPRAASKGFHFETSFQVISEL